MVTVNEMQYVYEGTTDIVLILRRLNLEKALKLKRLTRSVEMVNDEERNTRSFG